ncbi:MAG: L-threonylcarbamoyladenylate synthase [Chloroflexota bacterium]
MTQIVNTTNPDAIAQAVALLQQREVIAIPTDTVYGVAALALNPDAVAKIFQVKERPLDKPLPVFVPTIDDLDLVCQNVSANVVAILAKHWPGALTAVLPVSPKLPKIVVNNGDTVGVRIPDYPLITQLLAELQQPLAVTSANRSGYSNTQTALEVETQLKGRIPLILDGGPTASSVASTVVDFTQEPPQVLRQGAVYI